MAIKKFTKDGYGQIELNHVAWRRDGRIEAQCELDPAEFNEETGRVAENGTLFAIDNVSRVLKTPTLANSEELPIGVNYSSELTYSTTNQALKHFHLKPGESLPRIGLLAVGDRFTTNAFAYDDTGYTSEELVVEDLSDLVNNPLYAGINDAAEGYLTLSASVPAEGPVFKVVEKTTMPDGQLAIKVQVLSV